MGIEDLKKFDGSIEGAAQIADAEGGDIDWHAISENLGTLQDHLKKDRENLEVLKNQAYGFEEQVLQLLEDDPTREQVIKKWQEFKDRIKVFEADRVELEDLIKNLMHIDFSKITLHRDHEDTVQ